MISFSRTSLLVAALALVGGSTAGAQTRREKELRVDFIGFEAVDGTTTIGLGLPGTVALGIYLNKNIAIEPTISYNSTSGDGFSASFLQAGVFVPYYLKGDAGRSGLFVSPGLMYGKVGGDLSSDGTIDFGVDFGMKRTMRENVVMRLAANLRTGDSYEDVNGDSQIALGATFGIGIFWK